VAIQEEAGVSGDAGTAATEFGAAAAGGAPRQSAPLVLIEAATVRFGRTVALDQASLAIHPGDTLAIVGPDGAGKTTLLRVLAGVLHPVSGKVTSSLSPAGLGYAGAAFDLYGDLTVLENLSFFGRVRGMEEGRLRARIGAMLALTGLEEARDRLAGRLSGGMKKGLSLACALVHEPALLLLDEPTVGVDPVSRQKLWDIISEATAGGTALVYTSSYLEEADHAVRLVSMSGGRLVETTVERVMAESTGWSAWVMPLGAADDDGSGVSRMEVRARLASGASDPRVYLRPEGLTVLASDEASARELLAERAGEGFPTAYLARGELTFEDAFVLMERRNRGGERPVE
jgi:ABC-2 type transport system ATP-binding protein